MAAPVVRESRAVTSTRLEHDRGAFPTLRTFLRHWLAHRRLKAGDRSIRTTDPPAVSRAYDAMSPSEFEAINGPQDWLNRRVIPRVLASIDRGRPWRIVDLGCGNGGSARILAQHAPPGSSVIGYDLCGERIAQARQRALRDAAGSRVAARFVCQSMLEPLQDPDGGVLADRSVDVAHAAGVVGHHLRAADVRVLAAELQRVLAADGIAVLDAGPRLPPRALTRTMAEMGFKRIACRRLIPFATRAALVFRWRDAQRPRRSRSAEPSLPGRTAP